MEQRAAMAAQAHRPGDAFATAAAACFKWRAIVSCSYGRFRARWPRLQPFVSWHADNQPCAGGRRRSYGITATVCKPPCFARLSGRGRSANMSWSSTAMADWPRSMTYML